MSRLLQGITLVVFVLLTSCDKSGVEDIRGDVSGKVLDAQTGNPLNNATVYIVGYQSSTQTTTDASGNYSISKVPSGPVTLRATLAAYSNGEASVSIPKKSLLSDANIALLPQAFGSNKFAIILTWGSVPYDLDSHLYVPNGGPYYEISYLDKGDNDGTLDSVPFAGLDLDNTSGFGPETTTILMSGANPHYPGVYRFFVHNFSQDATLANSGAVVRVYANGVLVKNYSVPTSGSGIYWHVFDLQGSTFTDYNTVSDSVPATP